MTIRACPSGYQIFALFPSPRKNTVFLPVLLRETVQNSIQLQHQAQSPESLVVLHQE